MLIAWRVGAPRARGGHESCMVIADVTRKINLGIRPMFSSIRVVYSHTKTTSALAVARLDTELMIDGRAPGSRDLTLANFQRQYCRSLFEPLIGNTACC
jgi:hypothetical protein